MRRALPIANLVKHRLHVCCWWTCLTLCSQGGIWASVATEGADSHRSPATGRAVGREDLADGRTARILSPPQDHLLRGGQRCVECLISIAITVANVCLCRPWHAEREDAAEKRRLRELQPSGWTQDYEQSSSIVPIVARCGNYAFSFHMTQTLTFLFLQILDVLRLWDRRPTWDFTHEEHLPNLWSFKRRILWWILPLGSAVSIFSLLTVTENIHSYNTTSVARPPAPRRRRRRRPDSRTLVT